MSELGGGGAMDAGEIVRVVRGEPDEVELAALVAGIIAAAASLESEHLDVVGLPAWSDHTRRLGGPPVPGPHTWRWSLRG